MFLLPLFLNQLCIDEKKEMKNIEPGGLCSSHGGDLLEHSQWCALQVLLWFKNKDPITEDLDIKTSIIAAFFHDIGKGIDCIYNMYDPRKYDNANNDYKHTEYSGDVILGLKLVTNCEKNININIKDLIEKYFTDVNIKDIALTSYMHWEFGKINIPLKENETMENKYEEYIKSFLKYASKVGCDTNDKSNLLKKLKLCILIGCADIAGSTNIRLLNDFKEITYEQIYPSNDTWTKYGMDKNYLNYRERVIEIYTKKF